MAPKARTAFQFSAVDLKFFEAKFGEKLPVVLPTLRFGAQLFRAAKTSVDNSAIQQALDKLDGDWLVRIVCKALERPRR